MSNLIVKVRAADEATKARWEAAAKKAGASSTAEFIRDAIEAKIEGRQTPAVTSLRTAAPARKFRPDFKKGAKT